MVMEVRALSMPLVESTSVSVQWALRDQIAGRKSMNVSLILASTMALVL